VERMLHYACVGSRETAGRQLWDFIAATEADEIMLTAQIHDHRARLRSFELAAEILEECQLTRQVRYA